MPNQIIVQVPGMSKAMLADMLGGVQHTDPRFRAKELESSAKLNTDPATIALVSTVATVVTSELVKAAVGAFIELLKRNKPKHPTDSKVQVTVALTLGGRQQMVVDPTQLDTQLQDLPSDLSEVSHIRLEVFP
jgi:hypothetical protein